MKSITFRNIFYRGEMVAETELFQHNHTAEMLLFYDGNFLQFKRMPSVDEFREAADYLRQFHAENGQKHVKFLFPEGEELPLELADYLKELGYDLGFMELYGIDPSEFPVVNPDSRILIEKVSEESLETFLSLKFEIDQEFGTPFAAQKKIGHEKNFQDERFLQVMAFFEDTPVGVVDLIVGENTVEIDGLVVLDSYQKKGIGSRLQQFVMKEFPNKTVILVADGEDTPKEMYQKQNYQYFGFKYEALKVYND